MTEVEIPFHRDMADASLDHRKIVTSRFTRYGVAGDTFRIDGRAFVLTGVYRLQLGFVADHLYREGGFDSPEAFWGKWREIHPRRCDPKLMVWTHFFEEVA